MENKFNQIYTHLAEEISAGKAKPGSMLPSENELASRFSTSRETIRKSLQLLAEHGYIQKLRGKGSVVLEQSKVEFPVSGLTSFKELADRMPQHVETIVHQLSEAKATAEQAALLQCDHGEQLWDLKRIRLINGQAVIYDHDLLLREIAPNLSRKIAENSVYHYLEQQLGLKISYAKKEFVVEDAEAADTELLDMDSYQQLVVVKSFVFLEDTTLFQYTESKHRPDKFRFTDFARRTKK